MKNILYSIVMLFGLVISLVAQDVPRVISYQGVLVRADGKPVDTTEATVKISFYDAESGGNALSSTSYTVNIIGGLFSTIITIPPASAIDLNQQLWLEVEYSGIQYKRVQLAASLYALNIADNVVTSAKIKDGEVKAIDIGDYEVVKSIKGLKEAIDIVTGNQNIRIKVDDQNIVIEGKDTVKAAEQLIGGIPSGVPVGSIIAYWGNTPPEGWLLCDSSKIPDEYQSLSEFLGSTRTPDLRGMFLRGANTTINAPSKGNNGDTDEGSRSGGIGVSKIGSMQNDAFQSHNHTISVKRTGGIQMNYVAAPGTYDDAGTAATNMSGTSSETRPKNVYVNYIIKAR